MSEHNPFAAPVGAALPQPTNSLVPSAFTPPVPVQMPPPPAAQAPPAPVSYDHPSMTLTELSFAPVAPPAAPEAPPAPPAAQDRLVNDILPAGGATRSLSVGRGRLPMVALIVVALLAAGGVVFGTGLLQGDEPPPPVRKSGLAGNGKLTGTPAEVKAKTNTLGAGYVVVPPTGYAVTLGTVRPEAKTSTDVVLAVAATGQKLTLSSAVDTLRRKDGPVTAAQLAKLKADAIKRTKGKALPGQAAIVVGGVKATGFDIAAADGKTHLRTMFFVRRGTLYTATWQMAAATFTPSLNTFNKVLATVRFAAEKAPVKPTAAKK